MILKGQKTKTRQNGTERNDFVLIFKLKWILKVKCFDH